MKTLLSALLIVLVLSLDATAEERTGEDVIRYVSIIGLIGSPERYDGKRVHTVGFLRVEFEGDAVYLHREDYLRGLTRNAVLLVLPDKNVFSKYDKQYVLVEGIFVRCDDSRSLCIFSGHIEKINRLELWPFDRE